MVGLRLQEARGSRGEYNSEEENIMNQLKFDKKTKIKGYSELLVTIEYIPTEIGVMDYDLTVYFENFLHSPSFEVKLR